MMCRILLLCVVCLAGCQHLSGPFAPRSMARVDDPRLSIGEQESRGRDRYALPNESRAVGPSAGTVLPGR
ncbi:MAG: hypothetical protein HYR84_13345 [Planctomycetes bacterium]|nr:hypothetical protein [Planctomycetota bacterium]